MVRVQGVGFRMQGVGFGPTRKACCRWRRAATALDEECVPRPGCEVSGSGRKSFGSRVQRLGFLARVQGGGFRGQGLHFTVCTV